MGFQSFNQLASEFLVDLGVVFPDDEIVGKASRLLNTCMSMNENSYVPALTFMNGKPVEVWRTLDRTMFEIPGAHLQGLVQQMNDENRAIMQRYIDNMAELVGRINEDCGTLNKTLGELKQGDAFSQIQAFTNNPQELLASATSGKLFSKLGGVADSLDQSKELEEMSATLSKSMEGLAPLLAGKIAQGNGAAGTGGMGAAELQPLLQMLGGIAGKLEGNNMTPMLHDKENEQGQ